MSWERIPIADADQLPNYIGSIYHPSRKSLFLPHCRCHSMALFFKLRPNPELAKAVKYKQTWSLEGLNFSIFQNFLYSNSCKRLPSKWVFFVIKIITHKLKLNRNILFIKFNLSQLHCLSSRIFYIRSVNRCHKSSRIFNLENVILFEFQNCVVHRIQTYK